MNELDFNWKYKDYELRACPQRLVKFNEEDVNETIDLIKWEGTGNNRSCFSLAYWRKVRDGYDLYLVGTRFFDYIDKEDLSMVMEQLHKAQKILDAFYQRCEE